MRQNLPALLHAGLGLASTLVLAAVAQADLITGQVVDSNGVPVAGVNIDAFTIPGDNNTTIFNDGTDAGGFFSTTIPPGTYRIHFHPPPPPASSSLDLDVQPVTVLGTVNMGVIFLPPARSLTGRALDPQGVPVPGINLDVIDLATGDNLNLVGDTTNALGEFALNLPFDPLEVRFDTTPVTGQVLAPEHVFFDASESLAMGDFTIPQGFLVTAIVRDPNGFPVVGADADAIDVTTGEKRYTPGDNTNGSGFVDFVVAAGTYDFTFCPLQGEQLACAIARAVPVTANTSLGIITMPAGLHLFGTVTDGALQPIQNVNIDVKDSVTLLDLPLQGDSTDAAGQYDLLIPAGTYKVTFDPPFSLPLAADVHLGVSVTTATQVNGILPPCSFFQTTGSGVPGTGGIVPQIAASGGTPRLGNHGYTIEVSSGLGGAIAMVEFSYQPLGGGGTGGSAGPFLESLRVAGSGAVRGTVLSGAAGAAGAGSGSFPWPISGNPALAGLTLHALGLVRDPGAATGVSVTPRLNALICP